MLLKRYRPPGATVFRPTIVAQAGVQRTTVSDPSLLPAALLSSTLTSPKTVILPRVWAVIVIAGITSTRFKKSNERNQVFNFMMSFPVFRKKQAARHCRTACGKMG
jgi:hypothetical protein